MVYGVDLVLVIYIGLCDILLYNERLLLFHYSKCYGCCLVVVDKIVTGMVKLQLVSDIRFMLDSACGYFAPVCK